MDVQTASFNRPFRQDPQSNLSISIKEDICEVTFRVWDLDGQEIEGVRGRVSFDHGWACEYVMLEIYSYPEQKELCSSDIFLWKLTQSSWLTEKIDQRTKIYPTWLNQDRREYFHFLIEGHDNYIEVIASGFKIDLITQV